MSTKFNMQVEIRKVINLGAEQDQYLFGLCHEVTPRGSYVFEWLCLNTIAFMHLEGIRFSTDLSVLPFKFHNYGTMDKALRDQMISDAQAAFELRYDL